MTYAWHVTVTDPGEPVTGRGRVIRRFRFTTQEDAWSCYVSAIQAGFEAEGEQVQVMHEREAVAA